MAESALEKCDGLADCLLNEVADLVIIEKEAFCGYRNDGQHIEFEQAWLFSMRRWKPSTYRE
jgi:hypothetical protein